jgi:hypothetical protein
MLGETVGKFFVLADEPNWNVSIDKNTIKRRAQRKALNASKNYDQTGNIQLTLLQHTTHNATQ